MTWTKLDDNAHANGKIDVLSDGAFRLWTMANCWSRQRENIHTNGFVPRALLSTISRGKWEPRVLRRLVAELVRVIPGVGTSGEGLWTAVGTDGWQIHDWKSYGPPDEPLSASERGRLGGRRSVEARKSKSGSAVPHNAPNARSTKTASMVPLGQMMQAEANRSKPVSFETASSNQNRSGFDTASAEANSEATEAPIPIQILNKSLSKDLTGTQDRGRPVLVSCGRMSAEELDRRLEQLPRDPAVSHG